MSQYLLPITSIKQSSSLLTMGVRVFIEQVAAGQWAEQIKAFGRGGAGAKGVCGNALHPCFINHQPTLVHAVDLAEANPEFYADLQRFARQHGYQLLADRRSRDSAVGEERRGRLLPVMVFSLGVSSTAFAAAPATQPSAQRTLALFERGLDKAAAELTAVDHLPVAEQALPALASDEIDSEIDSVSADLALEIETILREHYVANAEAPAHIEADLHEMATYFARYPASIELLRSLKGRAWQLQYAADTFETEVRGNALQIHSVKVSFDTRAAAMLRKHRACDETPGACIASPADALLHELLHAQSALLNPRKFIADGGINSVIYPFEHEREVIGKENALYRAMTEVDGHYRPHRHRHAGQVVASNCVTCLR